MAKKLNSASRILLVLEEAVKQNDRTQVLEVWMKVFSLKETQAIKCAFIVTQLLQVMHKELELASDGITKAGISTSLYKQEFSNIENAISPLNLSNTWHSARQYLAAEVIKTLAFCAEILPDEESQISQDELTAIQNQVDELREALNTATLPDRLMELIEHHILLIEKALLEYRVVGAKALREAGRTALGELIEVKAEVIESKDELVIKKLYEMWKNVNSAADVALKVEKIAKLGQQAWDVLSNLLH